MLLESCECSPVHAFALLPLPEQLMAALMQLAAAAQPAGPGRQQQPGRPITPRI